jgi:hypothetical protein
MGRSIYVWYHSIKVSLMLSMVSHVLSCSHGVENHPKSLFVQHIDFLPLNPTTNPLHIVTSRPESGQLYDGNKIYKTTLARLTYFFFKLTKQEQQVMPENGKRKSASWTYKWPLNHVQLVPFFLFSLGRLGPAF